MERPCLYQSSATTSSALPKAINTNASPNTMELAGMAIMSHTMGNLYQGVLVRCDESRLMFHLFMAIIHGRNHEFNVTARHFFEVWIIAHCHWNGTPLSTIKLKQYRRINEL